MRKILASIITFSILSVKLIGQPLPNIIPLEKKLFYASKLYSEIVYNFAGIDKISNIDSLYEETIGEIINSTDDYNYYKVLKKFLASLNDGHTEVVMPNDYRKFCDYPPIQIVYLDSSFYVYSTKEIFKDSIQVGDEVLEVNHLPIKEYLNKYVSPFISASTKASKLNFSVYAMHYDLDTIPFIVKVKRRTSGTTSVVHFKRDGEKKWKGIKSAILVDLFEKFIDFKIVDGNYGYLAVNSFQDFVKKDLISALNKIDTTKLKGLVIDLRMNGGGSTGVGMLLLSHIITNKFYLTYGYETRVNEGVKRALGIGYEKYKKYYNNLSYQYYPPDTVVIPDSVKKISCPMVILIGPHTYSAAEDFLMMLYEIPQRPILVGEETGGSTGAPLVVELTSDGYARICTRRQIFPVSGKRFANSGITPDFEVHPTITDLLNKKDVVLDKALEILSSKKSALETQN